MNRKISWILAFCALPFVLYLLKVYFGLNEIALAVVIIFIMLFFHLLINKFHTDDG